MRTPFSLITRWRTELLLPVTIPALLLLFSCRAEAQPPSFGDPIDMGLVANDQINEASGLVASRQNVGVLWTNNDSGDTTRVFALGTDGRDLGTYYLEGITARDWEELAIGPGPIEGIDYLYVGDIGDNMAQFEVKRIYRVPEPVVDSAAPVTSKSVGGVETISFRYPDGPRDAEGMFVDPRTRDIYIISKREVSVNLYRLPWPQSTHDTLVPEHVATLDSITLVTAADISANGKHIVVKNYLLAYYWGRGLNESVGEAMSRSPLNIPYTPEPQGESVGWKNDPAGEVEGYYTVSEEPQGIPAHLSFYPRLEHASAPDRSDERRESILGGDGPGEPDLSEGEYD